MTEPTASPADPLSRLAASRRAYAALQLRIAAREPWALAADFGSGPEASWGPREVLGHVTEMLPFWLGEYERIVVARRSPGLGLPFGRTSADTLRLGVLERDRTLPLRELFDRIDSGVARWERRIEDGTIGEGTAAGLHSARGEMTAEEVRDRFVVSHLEEHVKQLENILAAR
jgi:hypothetical protein